MHLAERTSSRLRRTNGRNVLVVHEDHEDDENVEIGVPLGAFRVQSKKETVMLSPNAQKLTEIIKQISSLKEFYVVLGIDSLNTMNIFNSTLAYLKGEISFTKVQDNLNSLVIENKLVTEREINLLNCLDELVHSVEESRNSKSNLESFSYKNIA